MKESAQEPLVARWPHLSDRQRVEAALRESEERYRSFYEHIPLMCFTLDPDGVVLSVNQHGIEELGYPRGELVGQSVLKVFHPDDRPIIEQQFRTTLETPGTVARWELRKVRRDGTMLWVREAARAMRGTDGKLAVLVICEDVTEAKETERAILEHERKLRTLASELSLAEERERRRIAAGLHDQIGNPLAYAKMRLGELAADALPAGVARTLEEVDGILSRAIRETRSLTFELSSPILYELGLESALESLGEQIVEANGVDFAFETDGAPKPLSEDLEITLFRAVEELLWNVVKHARARRVRVRVERHDHRIRITVADDGTGFDESRIANRQPPRDGLGLFSIRERLDHLGGHLEIETAPGAGTRIMATASLARDDG